MTLTKDARSAAHSLPCVFKTSADRENKQPSKEPETSLAPSSSTSTASASAAGPASATMDAYCDESRGADASAAGDLFDSDSTLLEKNPLFQTLGKNETATTFHHEEILRMASRRTIAEMAECYKEKTAKEVKNKRISARLDVAKSKVAEARGIRRKDVVMAFENKKMEHGVEKKKNKAAGAKRQAALRECNGRKGKAKAKKQKLKHDSEAEDDDDDEDPPEDILDKRFECSKDPKTATRDLPLHLQPGAIERGLFTVADAANALVALSRADGALPEMTALS